MENENSNKTGIKKVFILPDTASIRRTCTGSVKKSPDFKTHDPKGIEYRV